MVLWKERFSYAKEIIRVIDIQVDSCALICSSSHSVERANKAKQHAELELELTVQLKELLKMPSDPFLYFGYKKLCICELIIS